MPHLRSVQRLSGRNSHPKKPAPGIALSSSSVDRFEDRVIDWIALETGTLPGRVSLTSRVPDDFDIDEVETVELFEKFGEQFQVDLAVLRDHWLLYFHPIGMPITYPFFIPVVIGTMAYFMFPEAVARIPAWGDAILFVAVLWWACRKFHALHIKKKIPINVQDLVNAGVAGKWTKVPPGW